MAAKGYMYRIAIEVCKKNHIKNIQKLKVCMDKAMVDIISVEILSLSIVNLLKLRAKAEKTR